MFVGNPPGNYDRLLDFSTAVTGNLFFVPTADIPRRRDRPIRKADTSPRRHPTRPHLIPPTADGSLGIGSLKGEPSL